jgi:hypothetical protein
LPTLFGNDLVLVAALNIVGEGHKHPLALIEGATQNTAVVQVLIDNLIEGLIPTSPVSPHGSIAFGSASNLASSVASAEPGGCFAVS